MQTRQTTSRRRPTRQPETPIHDTPTFRAWLADFKALNADAPDAALTIARDNYNAQADAADRVAHISAAAGAQGRRLRAMADAVGELIASKGVAA